MKTLACYAYNVGWKMEKTIVAWHDIKKPLQVRIWRTEKERKSGAQNRDEAVGTLASYVLIAKLETKDRNLTETYMLQ